MSSKTSPQAASPIHPPVGTLIDGGSLELVEVLGVGGYGVVYRAVDPRYPSRSYAVKCLVASGHQTARQRQTHIREIALHQLASAHPGVVTLHRVVDQGNHTYIVMDYAPDHDLFTQILHSCRYLGDDGLIKDVFLQLLDAVEYCHSLGIYHRDLKPENILCFDDGLRVAITDFGLATTDKVSDEFRTGSVYHMSPECQGGEFAPTGHYSPMSNDIWSLGIILLNLATGRNPWKSATPGDPTFQAYLRDPMAFLPSVLPISPEINEILVRMLEVDWRERASIREVRYAIEEITSFYSDGVVFEGSMARCPWESSMDIDSASSSNEDEVGPQSPPAQSPLPMPEEDVVPKSHWSKDSSSDIVFAAPSFAGHSSYGARWTTHSSCNATWDFESPVSSESDYEQDDHYHMDFFDRSETPSSAHTAQTSMPTTPECFDQTFGARLAKPDLRTSLMINTNIPRPRIYDASSSMSSFSPGTSIMHTAIEYDPYSSMFFVNSVNSPASPKAVVVMPDSAITAVGEDKEMISPSMWTPSSATQMSSPSTYSDSSSLSSFAGEDQFERSRTPSPEPNTTDAFQWASRPLQVESLPLEQCSPPHSLHNGAAPEPSALLPPLPSSPPPSSPPQLTYTASPRRSAASQSSSSLGRHHRRLHRLHQLRRFQLDALQLSHLVHPLRAVKALLRRLTRLPGMQQKWGASKRAVDDFIFSSNSSSRKTTMTSTDAESQLPTLLPLPHLTSSAINFALPAIGFFQEDLGHAST
ncbi:kinase-like protein [Pholiota conissans]|uniref:non-specific serine/threonine protein kinase n=1 Tax=Pholiota conissans TaxID=109636 RepID=A0A9P5Z8R7_9AGAR|nr:kinase-like protein [Pholiota conissans]